jgi:hypothetical protein
MAFSKSISNVNLSFCTPRNIFIVIWVLVWVDDIPGIYRKSGFQMVTLRSAGSGQVAGRACGRLQHSRDPGGNFRLAGGWCSKPESAKSHSDATFPLFHCETVTESRNGPCRRYPVSTGPVYKYIEQQRCVPSAGKHMLFKFNFIFVFSFHTSWQSRLPVAQPVAEPR